MASDTAPTTGATSGGAVGGSGDGATADAAVVTTRSDGASAASSSAGSAALPRPHLSAADVLGVYSGPRLTATARKVTETHLAAGLSPDDMVLVPLAHGTSASLTRADMLRHFAGRYPVYYGAPQRRMYRADACEALGLCTNDLGAAGPGPKYVVGGPVWKYGEKAHATDTFAVIHAYAPNLESATTADARVLFRRGARADGAAGTGGTELDDPAYRAHIGAMFDAVAKAAVALGVTAVALPLIGQGAFLSAVDRAATAAANGIFAEELARVSAAAREDGVEFALFVMSEDLKRAYQRPGVSVHCGSLFRAHAVLDGKVALLNAWDDQSLIGNGLNMDATIDGWMVSGASHGRDFVNSSFAHNVVLLRAADRTESE